METTATPCRTDRTDSFAPFRYSSFRYYFSIRFCFTFAMQMQTTIIGFYIYQLTHSKLAIALIGLSEVIPALTIALYGGYIADRSEKRKMLLILFGGIFCTSLVILAVTHQGISGAIPVRTILVTIYAMLFCNGVARAFYEPAIFTVYTESIPRELYPKGSTWSSLSWQASAITGPLAGGFLYLKGVSAPFIMIVVLVLISWLLVARLKKFPAAPMEKKATWKDLSAGFRFVFNNKMLLYTMSLDLFSVFFGGVTALLPVYAIDILKVGAAGLGVMRTAFSAGAAITMLMLVRFSPMGRPWRNLLLTVTGFACAIIGFGLSHVYYLSLLFLFMQGAFDSVSVIIRSTIMQLLTPEKMRGRVSAVNAMFIGSSAELGDFESGMAAGWLGTVPAVIFGGSMTLFIVVYTYFRTRKLIPGTLQDIRPEEKDTRIAENEKSLF